MDDPSETITGIGGSAPGAPAPEARRGPRRSIFRLAGIRRSGAPEAVLRVRNLSAGGLMADCVPQLDVGETLELELHGIGAVTARVAWIERGRVGLAFARPIDPELVRDTTPRSVGATTTIMRPNTASRTRRSGLDIA